MHVNLGKPYELIIEKVIKDGYASSQTEVLRQALINYKDTLNKEYIMTQEEEKQVAKAVEAEMKSIKKNKEKWYTLEEVKRELGLEDVVL